VVFVLASINVLYYIYRFAYAEPLLNHWDEADLAVVNDLLDVLLDLVCHYFIEDFCINVFQEIGL
jgi:predicted Zn-dependent protease with MMP-like domain